MKLSKRELKRIIREAFTEETNQNFDTTLDQFQENFIASCEQTCMQIANDGNHNTHEVLELLEGIVNEVIADLFETMPM